VAVARGQKVKRQGYTVEKTVTVAWLQRGKRTSYDCSGAAFSTVPRKILGNFLSYYYYYYYYYYYTVSYYFAEQN